MRRHAACRPETTAGRGAVDDITAPQTPARAARARRWPTRERARRLRLLGLWAITAALLAGCGDDSTPPPSTGRTFHATPDGTGSDCGTLQACLDAAAAGDTIELAGGRYTAIGDTLAPPLPGAGPVVAIMALRGAPRDLVIRARHGEVPVIDGLDDPGRIGLALPDNLARLRLEGIRFERCWAGVRAAGGTVSARDCEFVLGEHGIVADGTTLDVAECVFQDQASESLVLRDSGGTLEHVESLGSGAGLYAAASRDLEILGSRFGPFSQAGLRFEEGGSARLTECTVYGAGMLAVDSTGVVVAGDAALSIERSIVASNRGFGIDCRTGGTVTIACSDIWGNSGGDYRGCPPATGTGGVISADPRFCSTGGSLDLHLSPDSPARSAACGVMGAYGATACNPGASAAFRE